MGSELVGGANAGETGGLGAAERLADAQRLVRESRQRLQALTGRLAELRLRLGAPPDVSTAETAGSVPSLEMPSS